MQQLQPSRLSTETPTFNDLIAEVKRGAIKIPQFQRKFIWKEPQAFKLLDSISKNYPIGSLLIWRTDVKLEAERNIGNFQLPHTDDMSPTDYVLDGQQRLTVIYSSLAADKQPGFSPGFDLENQQFLLMEDASGVVFPLRSMYDTTKVLNFRTGLQTRADAEIMQARLDQLIDAFTKYKLPVVTLKNLTVEEVCPIFERINSSGTKLSTYDLMVAATWSKEFNLNSKVEEITASLKPKHFGKIEPDTVLKCLAAIHFSSIKQDQMITLRKLTNLEMEGLVANTKQALLRSIDVLSTEFGVRGWSLLPYEAIVIVLTYIHSRFDSLSPKQQKCIRQWFWRSAFSQRYRVGGENFISKDLMAVSEFVEGKNGTASDFGEAPKQDFWAKTAFRANNSTSLALILALASKNPQNITNGAAVDVEQALSHFNKKEFHHIYPKNYLKTEKLAGEPNALANICMLAASENKKISDDNPNHYLPTLIAELGGKADEVFSSNLLPLPSSCDYSNLVYSEFVNIRSLIITDFSKILCEG
jgi:hypothetical protein